jgi:hypothetical protein
MFSYIGLVRGRVDVTSAGVGANPPATLSRQYGCRFCPLFATVESERCRHLRH